MDATFWHERWKNNQIPFHENAVNPLLVKYFKELSLPPSSRIFVPLCGKTLDIAWLLSQGFRVAGVEWSKIGIEQLFSELELKPGISQDGDLAHYRANNIEIFVGDIFDLSRKILGPIDAIYDRAALVALPEMVRARYAAHLRQLTNSAPQLLICYEYDQRLMEGPPFSIAAPEVKQHYQQDYDLSILARANVPGGLKGRCAAQENVWLLRRLINTAHLS